MFPSLRARLMIVALAFLFACGGDTNSRPPTDAGKLVQDVPALRAPPAVPDNQGSIQQLDPNGTYWLCLWTRDRPDCYVPLDQKQIEDFNRALKAVKWKALGWIGLRPSLRIESFDSAGQICGSDGDFERMYWWAEGPPRTDPATDPGVLQTDPGAETLIVLGCMARLLWITPPWANAPALVKSLPEANSLVLTKSASPVASQDILDALSEGQWWPAKESIGKVPEGSVVSAEWRNAKGETNAVYFYLTYYKELVAIWVTPRCCYTSSLPSNTVLASHLRQRD